MGDYGSISDNLLQLNHIDPVRLTANCGGCTAQLDSPEPILSLGHLGNSAVSCVACDAHISNRWVTGILNTKRSKTAWPPKRIGFRNMIFCYGAYAFTRILPQRKSSCKG